MPDYLTSDNLGTPDDPTLQYPQPNRGLPFRLQGPKLIQPIKPGLGDINLPNMWTPPPAPSQAGPSTPPAGTGPSGDVAGTPPSGDPGSKGEIDRSGKGIAPETDVRMPPPAPEPDRAPALPPAGGSGDGGGFTQVDTKTGEVVSAPKPGSDEARQEELWSKINKMDQVDPAKQARTDLGAAPQYRKLGAMDVVGPLLAGLLGGPFAFAGAAEGIANAYGTNRQEVLDYQKRLTDLTAAYRKETDTNKRAAIMDQIHMIHDQIQARLTQAKLKLQDDRNRIYQQHVDDQARLGAMRIQENANIAQLRADVMQAISNANRAERAEEFDARMKVVEAKEAAYEREVANLISERTRSNDIRQAEEAIHSKRLSLDQAKAAASNYRSMYDAIGTQIVSVERSKAFAQDRSVQAEYDKVLESLKASQEEAKRLMTEAEQYKPPEGGVLPQGVVPPGADPNKKYAGKSLAELRKMAQAATNKPTPEKIKAAFPGISDVEIQYILAP